MTISSEQRRLIRECAANCCEYCRVGEVDRLSFFHIDHIISLKHGGTDNSDNLCLACYRCNGCKGSNIAALDPETRNVVRLYNPRQQSWEDHFQLNSNGTIMGLTPEGRATIAVLLINEDSRVQHRQTLMELGVYPCEKETQ